MKILLLGDDGIRLTGPEGHLTIEAESYEQSYSPYHMLGSSLATCTWAVLTSWASQAKLDADELSLEVRWRFDEDPYRVGSMALTIIWPSLPELRRAAAQRAATLCPVHHTLSHPPDIAIEVKG